MTCLFNHFTSYYELTISYWSMTNVSVNSQIFWFGDLNYRLNMGGKEVRKFVEKKKWAELLNSDQVLHWLAISWGTSVVTEMHRLILDILHMQLTRELRNGHVFDGWKEGVINFAPTYKYVFNSDRYVCENPKEGEKKRSPAWYVLAPFIFCRMK